MRETTRNNQLISAEIMVADFPYTQYDERMFIYSNCKKKGCEGVKVYLEHLLGIDIQLMKV